MSLITLDFIGDIRSWKICVSLCRIGDVVDPPLQESISDKQALLDALIENPEEHNPDLNHKDVGSLLCYLFYLSSFKALLMCAVSQSLSEV